MGSISLQQVFIVIVAIIAIVLVLKLVKGCIKGVISLFIVLLAVFLVIKAGGVNTIKDKATGYLEGTFKQYDIMENITLD